MKNLGNSSIFKANAIFYVLTVIIVGTVVLGIYASGIRSYYRALYPVVILDDDWVVSQNGTRIQETTLSKINTGVVNKAKTFILERQLPHSMIPSASLSFRTFQSTVIITIDDTQIYSYGLERSAAAKMLARKICFVPLPMNYSDKKLRIELTATEYMSFSGLGPFYFGNEQDLFNSFMEKRRLPFLIGNFLCIFGLFQLLWIPCILLAGSKNITPIFSALITVALGLYILSFYNIFDLFTDFQTVNTLLEYISLYLLPYAIAGFFASSAEKSRKLYGTFALINLAFILIVLLIHLFNVIHITQFSPLLYAIAVIETVPFIITVIKHPRKRRKLDANVLEETADKFLSYGFIIFALCGFINQMQFFYARFISGKESYVSIAFIIFGSIVFSTFLVLHYFLHSVCTLRAEATRQSLSYVAYSDPLTHLANRTKCEQTLQQLGVEKKPFILISFDLDNLKKVNDMFGHTEGDRMITTFAATLQKCFTTAMLIGRMGGDEFIVILADTPDTAINDLLLELSTTLEHMNQTETHFKYNVSFGYAKSSETQYGQRAHDIYMLADKRMYDMKRARHKKQGAAEQ